MHRRSRICLSTFALLLALAVAVPLVLVRAYAIPTASMTPTLEVGQRVLVDRTGIFSGEPGVGQVVVFRPPSGAEAQAPDDECGVARSPGTACLLARPGLAEATFIKRIVGAGGDRLEVRDGHVVRNGTLAPEPFVRECGGEVCNLEPFTVPAGHYFMMGDNRGVSNDSRMWGPLPRENVIGRAFATYWPIEPID